MDNSQNNSKLNNKPLFKAMPNEDAGVEEWRNWAFKLRDWAYAISKDEKQRRNKLKQLRRELKTKNAVLKHYKDRISYLEDKLDIYESCIIIKMINSFKALIIKNTGK